MRRAYLPLCLLAACAANEPAQPAPAAPPHDALEYARLDDTRFHMVSSADPGGLGWPGRVVPGNLDFGVVEQDCRREPITDPIHFTVRSAAPCPPGVDGLVLVSAAGPGRLARFWFTTLGVFNDDQWEDERLQVFVDGRLAHDVALAEAAAGRWPAGWPGARISGALVNYGAVAYRASLQIVLAKTRTKLYYYQADLVAGDRAPVREAAAAVPGPWRPAAETLYDAKGAGALLALGLRAPAAHAEALRALELVFDFDGVSSRAGVGDLCAAGHAWAPFDTPRVAVTLEGGVTCELRWGWPHGAHGRIAWAAPPTFAVEASLATAAPLASVPPGRFFAQTATHATGMRPGRVTWGEVAGDGRLAAIFVAAEGRGDAGFPFPDPLNFLEGDERYVIDGALAGTGTGTEDLFNGGFYFRDGPFGWRWGGVSFVGVLPGGLGRAQMARYYGGDDQVRFRRSFRGTLEIGVDNPDMEHLHRTLAIFYIRPEK